MSYKIEFNEAKKQVEITLKTLVDNAALVNPVAYKENGVIKGKPKFTIRCLLKTDKSQAFQRELIAATEKLCNGTIQVHQRKATANINRDYIVTDFLKIGHDILMQKKQNDEYAPKGTKKTYSESMKYLEDLCYFYANTAQEFPPKIFDRFSKQMEIENDDFFKPSFIGVVKCVVKRVPKFGSSTPNFGGQLVCYLQAVQYIEASTINFMGSQVSFDATDSSENMFGIESKTEEFGFHPTGKTNEVKPTKKFDDVDDYLNQYT